MADALSKQFHRTDDNTSSDTELLMKVIHEVQQFKSFGTNAIFHVTNNVAINKTMREEYWKDSEFRL